MSDISVNSLTGPVESGFRSEALAGLDKDAFLQLLVAQMRYQDPLNPSDSNEFLGQAVQYASVEQLENMASAQQQLYSMQLVSVATDLVGKEVTAIDSLSGAEVRGVVEMVKFGAEPILVVDGFDVALTSVIDVRADSAGAEESPTTPVSPEVDTADEADPDSADAPVDDVAPIV